MLNRKFVMALGAAMVLAVLYGCSSSNNGLRDDLDAANAQVAELEGQLAMAGGTNTELQTALDMATAEVTSLTGQLDMATAEVTRLTGELDTAGGTNTGLQTALDTANAAVTSLTGQLAAAKAEVTSLTGQLAAAKAEVTSLTGQLAALMTPAADDAYPAESALMEAIGGTAATANDPTFDELALEISITDVEADVAIGASGTTLTVTDEDTGATTTAVVYTNIEEPGDEEYNTYYADKDDHTIISDAVADGATGVVTVTLESDVSAAADLFNVGDFDLTAINQTATFNDDAATLEVNEREVAGTFHGVSGTFICPADGCTAVSGDDGSLETLSGSWTFTPDDVAEDADPHMILGVIADAVYTWYGHWAETDDDGELTVATFSGGKDLFVAADLLADVVHGTATYTGKAAGHYAAKTVTPHGEIATLKAGQFTADATLTASFGGGDVPANNKNEISGKITNFMDGGESIGSGWEVELEEAVVSNAVTGRTTGGGVWSAEFFGKAADDPDTATVDESVITPPNFVAGSFDASFLDGEVMGAFGATKD